MKKCLLALLLVLALLPAAATTQKKKKPASSAAKTAAAAKKAPAKSSAQKAQPGHKPGKAKVARAGKKSVKGAKREKTSARQKGSGVSRAQMELAQSMVREAYRLAQPLDVPQRVALLARLLYTLRPETMAAEKQQWAADLFVLAWQLPQETTAQRAARRSTMATAAARMAVYDADRALAMLDNEPAGESRADEADARSMAARLVFANYLQRHGAAGAQALADHALRWSEHGSYPYAATEAALARLRGDRAASEEFFRQELEVFRRGRDGLHGVSEFAGLLHQAAEMDAISQSLAEDAGVAVVEQLRHLAAEDRAPLTPRQKSLVAQTAGELRAAAPSAYASLREALPRVTSWRVGRVAPWEDDAIDAELEAAFREVDGAMRTGRGEELRAAITRGVQLLNARYPAASCAPCTAPDAQSVALVSLTAYASPAEAGKLLNGIADPYWRAYFMAIAAQQAGEPTRVADPAARKADQEEAEPE